MVFGASSMWRHLKGMTTADSRAGLSVDGSRIAFARTRRNKEGRLQVLASTVDRQADNDTWAERLSRQIGGIDTARIPLTSTLPDDSYQLLLVEAPDVPGAEANDAVRWQVKDLLDFPVEETVIELFDMPGQSSTDNKKMAYAVATRRSNIEDHVGLVRRAGFSLDAISIPELCARNISTRLPQDATGVAFLHLTDTHGLLTVSADGVLYMIRRIERGRLSLRSADDDFSRDEVISTIVLEVQRSLDYYDSHFDRRPLTELVLSPGSGLCGLLEALREQLGLSVSCLDLGQLFEMQNSPSAEEQGDSLLAIGAALPVRPAAV